MVQLETDDVTVLEKAEEVAETGIMKLIARAAMVVILPLGVYFFTDIKDDIQDVREIANSQNAVAVAELKEFRTEVGINLQAVEDKHNLVASRVTVVENNQERARTERKEREARADELWRQQQEQFRLLQQQLTTLTAQVAALTATVDALKVSIERRADLSPRVPRIARP